MLFRSRHDFRANDVSRSWDDFDGGALEDLSVYGLLHVSYSSSGDPTYRVSGDGLHFYRWQMSSLGGSVSQVEEAVRRLTDSPAFAERHPGSSHHLLKAFGLLWSDATDDQTISEIGDHLRAKRLWIWQRPGRHVVCTQ